jgi:hypothetical protein
VRGMIVMGWSASVRNRSLFKDLSSENAPPASLWGKSGCVAGPLQTQLCFRKVGRTCAVCEAPSLPAADRSRRLSAETVSKNIDAQTQQCGPDTQQGRLERSGPRVAPESSRRSCSRSRVVGPLALQSCLWRVQPKVIVGRRLKRGTGFGTNFWAHQAGPP